MNRGSNLDIGGYNPDALLNALIRRLGFKNDLALAQALEVPPETLSRIRTRKLSVGAGLLIRIHEFTGISTKELRALMGDRRAKFRMSYGQRLKAPMATRKET
jgi:hypothetical protein